MKRQGLFDPIFLLIFVVAGFLLLYRLDHRPFWQDEAETACLARNVLRYGVPKAYDNVNIISQEEGREFDADHVWRWSPWLQIYLAAAAFKIGGFHTWVGRFPFALVGLLCIPLGYLLVLRRFGDRSWAYLTAALLAGSVLFILYSRQCRYYSVGAFLALLSIYAFRGQWESRWGPALTLTLSLGLLFYTNYLLFFSFTGSLFLGALLLYRRELPWFRVAVLALITILLTVPGWFIFRIHQQSGMLDPTLWPRGLEHYFGNLCQFMIPLPVILGLAWRWRPRVLGEGKLLADPAERFVLFLAVVIILNTAVLTLLPHREHRYQIHLYPLCAMLLAWVVCKVYRYQKFSGVLLGILLVLTNWLYVMPLKWLDLINRPPWNDVHMLTYPNIPFNLYFTELSRGYPDANDSLIRFFQRHASPGDLILTTYGDLPLQFYTNYRVVGGLQWRELPSLAPPTWVVKRAYTRINRERVLNKSEEYILRNLNLEEDYQAVVLPYPDDFFGNRADPYFHNFLSPSEPFPRLTIYRKKSRVIPDDAS
jgi:4-amino-4-deoxy-L-arabinose transferase-like glycosyltransferase